MLHSLGAEDTVARRWIGRAPFGAVGTAGTLRSWSLRGRLRQTHIDVNVFTHLDPVRFARSRRAPSSHTRRTPAWSATGSRCTRAPAAATFDGGSSCRSAISAETRRAYSAASARRRSERRLPQTTNPRSRARRHRRVEIADRRVEAGERDESFDSLRRRRHWRRAPWRRPEHRRYENGEEHCGAHRR